MYLGEKKHSMYCHMWGIRKVQIDFKFIVRVTKDLSAKSES